MIHEGALQDLRVRSFDRVHGMPLDLRERNETRHDGIAIDEYRARTTLAFATPLFRAGQSAVLAQHVEQPPHGMRVHLHFAPVEYESHCVTRAEPRGE